MNKLYKQYPAFRKDSLQVSEIHKIYFEESGNPKGKPVILFHGGPGSKSKPRHRRIFNPKKWRVIMFDQRGCGKSKPFGEIHDNTTWDLLEDTEKLRKHLKINKWAVYGASWGSTLAIAYAEKYPKVVSNLIVSSIWLCRKKDVDWLFNGECLRRMFPDLWEWRTSALKKLGLSSGYNSKILFNILKNGTEKEKKLVSAIFENWEGQFYKVKQSIKLIKAEDSRIKDIESNKVLMHYVVNNCFFKDNQLVKEAKKLPKVPTVIIQGRYDVVCPLDNAWDLKNAVLHSKLEIIPGVGHHSSERGTINKLIEYTDRYSN